MSPEFYVLYNGINDIPDLQELKLSNAFTEDREDVPLELKVQVLNINKDHSLQILEKCSILKQYSDFINLVRKYAPHNETEGIETAITTAINNKILDNYLARHISEVKNMLIGDYSYEEDIAAQREEAFELGEKKGLELGENKNRLENAKNLLKEGIPVETIAKCIGLSVETVESLKEK